MSLDASDHRPAAAIADNTPVTFVVTGQLQPAAATRGTFAGSTADPGEAPPGELKFSLRLGAARSGAASHRATAVPSQDIVALHVAGGPVLWLHPHNARDLMLAQSRELQRSAGDAGHAGHSAEVPVPAQLGWPGLESPAGSRAGGWAGKVLLTAFQIFGWGGKAKDSAATLLASAVVARLDGQVETGVYGLSPDGLTALKGSGRRLDQVPSGDEPLLVLLHGTFVDTASTFGRLWTLYPDRVRALFAHYGGRVYALDHPTLGASPIANALSLVQALPTGARLHLATHSRGGLVAEVLARVCHQPRLQPGDLAGFDGGQYATQRQELLALAQQVLAKGIRVERVLRVACPARGTLLASRRLDAYLSVLRWALELTGLRILPALADFIAEVARRRADPGQLPGLAAMMPGSPLVEWLNNSPQAVDGELRVIAGDLQGDSVGSWLKTLLADAYYWTDNDVVVQTRSMYGGAPRQGGALFLLDRGGRVNHFNYFANDTTVQGLVAGLTEARPTGFGVIGPLSWAGVDASGWRAARAGAMRDAAAQALLPAVFVLPGILGSNLADGDERIWLSLRLVGGLSRLRYRAGEPDAVRPDGPIALVYDALIEHLATTHEVIEFAYDWRRPIEEEARRLADGVEAALDARQASGQPVRLLAHSMGGVVARVLQLERPAIFQRLMAHPGARLLMLGTPNGGSWAPMQVLSGDDTFGNTLAALGSPLANRRARQMMAEMPGFLQLQAGLVDDTLGLAREQRWHDLAEADLQAVRQLNWWHQHAGEAPEAAYEWGVPPQAVLDQARELRLRLDQQVQQDLPDFADRVCLVVGQAPRTPDGFEIDARGLAYLDLPDAGDGRVPLASAWLPGVRTWTLRAGHGELPSTRAAFEAYVELLQQGDTVRLSRLESASTNRAASVRHRSRPARLPASPLPPPTPAAVFATSAQPAGEAAAAEGARAAMTALELRVLNGNLSFIEQALLIGHYHADALSGTEAVVDRLVGGTMSVALAAGLYPDRVGTQQVFVNNRRPALNPWQLPRPPSVIVVGLGDEGQLREPGIVLGVRQATLAWAQRVAEDTAQGGAVIELAATLLGSGGMGISAAAAAAAVARGVQQANQRLQAGGWPVVQRLTLVELYLDRASEAWQALQLMATATPQAFRLAEPIFSGTGPLRRHLGGAYRGVDYDLISVTAGAEPDSLSFAMDTRRARTELRAQKTQGRLLRELVGHAAQDRPDDPQIGRTLFQLLVPVEVEPFLGGGERVVLELDRNTAPIPWELLDTGVPAQGNDARPWALRARLLRRLRKSDYRSQPKDAQADDAVLVIGEPLTDPGTYAPLPGARAEAEAVVTQLTGPGALDASRVRSLLGGAAAAEVINALFERPYRIVHIAGHGELPDAPRHGGGVVLSGGHFLGPREIESMRTVPELVFVNCCHLSAFPDRQALQTPDPVGLAAGVADALIGIGVRCVVAAGWAVDDRGAALFAAAFYRELLAGRRFIDAVAAAREAAWNDDPAGKTWAAYQCYGDPDWTWRSRTGDAQTVAPSLRDEYASIASPMALALALEETVTRLRWMGSAAQGQRDRLLHLEARFGDTWGDIGAVAEAFGLAWLECGENTRALGWYQRALQAGDGSATLRTQEQVLNLRVRVAWATARTAHDEAAGAGAGAGSRRALRAQTRAALAEGRAAIVAATQELQHLASHQPSTERLSLLGSAHKRLAMLEALAGRRQAELLALEESLRAYRDAETRATQLQDAALYYPALNRMALALVLAARRGQDLRWDATAAAHARSSLQAQLQRAPDFWNHVSVIELDLYQALAERRLAERRAALTAAYEDVARRVAAPWLWASVADQGLFVLAACAGARDAAQSTAALTLLQQLGRLAHPREQDFLAWQATLARAWPGTPPPPASPP